MRNMSHLEGIKSWADFRVRVTSLTAKEKGDAFEKFVLAYLKLEPQYTTLLQRVWLLRNVPTDVRTHLNLPCQDEGIDLIALTNEGTYWAIQCKYLDDENHSLSRKTLSTFTDLTFTVCRNLDYALVCTTAERYSHKLTLYGDRLGFLAGDVWRNLESDYFTRLKQYLHDKKAKIEPRKPRPHQQNAINNAETHFLKEGNKRGKMTLPCGTGKSLTGYWIAERLNAKTILVAVPSLALVRQTLKEWLRESVAKGHEVRWIAICSDESVAEQDRDDVAVLTQDLGIKIHTNPKEIAKWLGDRHDGLTVVFTTYQSGRAISEAARLCGITFDLAVMDEAHKTVGKRDSLFCHLLYDENISIQKRVFMTATERYYRGQSDQIVSMENHELYGDVFEFLSFKKALESNPPILSDYKIATITVTNNEIKKLIDENLYIKPDKGQWDDEVEAEMLASAIALRKAMLNYPIKHAVSFHKSIARAKAFKSTQDIISGHFHEFGPLQTYHVTGKTPTAVRSRMLEDFAKSGRSLITNARCLTEGVDVPDIDCVLFADPKKSKVDIVQGTGRALRISKGKKFGYVIIPILLDSQQEKFDPKSITDSIFESVLSVLRALAANDERIIEYFRSISHGHKTKGGDGPVEIDIPLGIEIDTDDFINSLGLRLWPSLAKLSWRPFEEARAFTRSLNLKGVAEWRLYCKNKIRGKVAIPVDIPHNPDRIYKDNGWVGYGDWLGTGNIATFLIKYRSFHEARNFVHKLKLKNTVEWKQYCLNKLPDKGIIPNDIPHSPRHVYANDGWINMGDWLGTGKIANFLKKYRLFYEAREFSRRLGLKSRSDWNKFCRGELPKKGSLPNDVPANPNQTYKNKGWVSMGDWLGTGTVAPNLIVYRPFEKAREFARNLNLKNVSEWRKYCKGELPEKGKLPNDISGSPHKTYKDTGWLSWGDWLGTETIGTNKRKFAPFHEARNFVHNLGLKSRIEWREYFKGNLPEKGKVPNDIPANPERTYKNKGWVSMGDWLGTGTLAPFLIVYRPFKEARNFARSLGLKNVSEWHKYCKSELPEKGEKPHDIPATPERTYKNNGWVGMGDWLGTGTIAFFRMEYRTFKEARDFTRNLGLKSQTEWYKYCRGDLPGKDKKPDDIPSNPQNTYKDKGWKGYGDWLGTGTIATSSRKYRSFEHAREFARNLKLGSYKEWRKYCQGNFREKDHLPNDIPKSPQHKYKNKGWKGWKDFLGN